MSSPYQKVQLSTYLDDKWIQHTLQSSTPISHRAFTNHSYYESFWERAEHGIIIVDENGTIMDANPCFYKMIETSKAEIIRKNIKDIVSKNSAITDIDNIRSVANGELYSVSIHNFFKYKNEKNSYISARLIITRIPSELCDDFEHIIIHIYPYEEETELIQNANTTNENDKNLTQQSKSWTEVFKSLFLQKWFIVILSLIITLIILLVAISGNLMPLLEKLIDNYQ